jgi:Protein of unknown function (DUF3352)
MTPGDSAIYASVSLQAGGSQNAQAKALFDKFPQIAGSNFDSAMNTTLDGVLKGSGLSHNDIRPWLGSQISFFAESDIYNGMTSRSPLYNGTTTQAATSSSVPSLGFLIASKDDNAAQAAITKARNVAQGVTWTSESHDGVTVQIGANSNDPSNNIAYSYVDHTLVLAPTSAVVDKVIDTDQGKTASLSSNGRYTAVAAKLPQDQLFFLYLDGQQLIGALKNQMPASSFSSGDQSGLNAFQGVGMALNAESNGFVLSGTETIDPSKLTPAARAQLGAISHQNTALAFTPSQAFGVYALAGVDKLASSLITELSGVDPSLSAGMRQLGITGNGGILSKLTGDIGVEVEPAAGSIPVDGALLIGTTDEAAMRSFLNGLPTLIGQLDPSLTLSVQHTTYKGTTIGSLTVGGRISLPDQPSWAVYKGMAIVASSPAGVTAVMDARDGQNITSTSGYNDAIPADQRNTGNMMYIDLQGIAQYVRSLLSSKDRLTFDLVVAPITNHFTEFSLTAQAGSNSGSFRLFLGIS